MDAVDLVDLKKQREQTKTGFLKTIGADGCLVQNIFQDKESLTQHLLSMVKEEPKMSEKIELDNSIVKRDYYVQKPWQFESL